MKIIEHSVEFITATPDIGKVIELGARNCYKSEDKMGEGTDEKLFNQIVKQNHHGSVAEHGVITVRIITDRTCLAQITRHRMFSYSVESQRYCNYSKDKFGREVTFVRPIAFQPDGYSNAYQLWKDSCECVEDDYFDLLEVTTPEFARSVLNNSVKTEIVMTGNVRSWRNFFELRTSTHAQKDIQYVARLIYQCMKDNGIPEYLFGDVVKA